MTVTAPYYVATGDEVEVGRAAYEARLPLLIIGPTGCGKTRYVEYLATQVTPSANVVTVACHEDLSSHDLLGRFLVRDEQTVWVDGPLTRAVRGGAICYLDELAEARRDTTVVIHPLSDHRRTLFIDRTGESLLAPDSFMLVASYNPELQTGRKRLKESTYQRFIPLFLGYPPPAVETEIVATEAGIDGSVADLIVTVGGKLRNLSELYYGRGVASTRSLVNAAKLCRQGHETARSLEVVLVTPVLDEPAVADGIRELIHAVVG